MIATGQDCLGRIAELSLVVVAVIGGSMRTSDWVDDVFYPAL